MSVAHDKLHEAVKLVVTEMLHDEKSEAREMLKQAVFHAIAQDPNVRDELVTMLRVELVDDRTDLGSLKTEVSTARGLLTSGLDDIKKLKATVKFIQLPWWQKIFRTVRTHL